MGDLDPAARSTGSRWFLRAAAVAAVLFATGVGFVPHVGLSSLVYNLVLFNLVPLLIAGFCLGTARRVPRERLAWWAVAATWVLEVIGDVALSSVTGDGSAVAFPVVANACFMAAFPLIGLVALVLVRVRAPRMRVSTWLDGAIGALGVAAALTWVVQPLVRVGGRMPGAAMLTYPMADVLLLAVLGATVAMLGLHADRVLLLITAAFACKLVGDVLTVRGQVQGGFVVGGPADLTWVGAALLTGAAAAVTRPGWHESARADGASRMGWRVLALPLTCNAVSLIILAANWGGDLSIGQIAAVGCVIAAFARTAVTLHQVRTLQDARQEARTDELTGLPNRRSLLAATQQTLAGATADSPAALLLMDLDGFKEVNDSLGHQAGDELLQQVGPRLRGALRAGDLLARLGGDEFAVLLPAISADAAYALAERLRVLLLQPFSVGGVRLTVGVSIGVGTAQTPTVGVPELLRCADAAMYLAKSSRAGVCSYRPDPGGGSDRVQVMHELRRALLGDELVIHLQPQVDLTNGDVVGAEALLRWQHPGRGLLHPGEVLPVAEQAGLLRPLTDRVLELALTAVSQWWSDRPVPVSVNCAAANLTDLDLPGKVADALQRHRLPAAALTLEFLEDTLAADPDRTRTALGQLRGLGVGTAIDHYGTGCGSLAQLRVLPADQLKLDRSLTAGVETDPRAAAIVRHTVTLASDLGLSLIAAGVEDQATTAMLARLGCHTAQGYAIARPMPATDFPRWLSSTASEITADGGRSAGRRPGVELPVRSRS
jgi:diguanylate cyclase (GGDEF)-like protein